MKESKNKITKRWTLSFQIPRFGVLVVKQSSRTQFFFNAFFFQAQKPVLKEECLYNRCEGQLLYSNQVGIIPNKQSCPKIFDVPAALTTAYVAQSTSRGSSYHQHFKSPPAKMKSSLEKQQKFSPVVPCQAPPIGADGWCSICTLIQKSDNLQYNTRVRWAYGTNDSLTKCLMFQVPV